MMIVSMLCMLCVTKRTQSVLRGVPTRSERIRASRVHNRKAL